MIFCDTSTLAKYYVSEPQSESVRASLDQADRVVVSELARVELMAVFHRCLRENKWDLENFRSALAQFQQDDVSGRWSWVPLEHAILEQAARTFAVLSAAVFLRSADCLHLVSALHHGFEAVHTHDLSQIKAARALGLEAVTIS